MFVGVAFIQPALAGNDPPFAAGPPGEPRIPEVGGAVVALILFDSYRQFMHVVTTYVAE